MIASDQSSALNLSAANASGHATKQDIGLLIERMGKFEVQLTELNIELKEEITEEMKHHFDLGAEKLHEEITQEMKDYFDLGGEKLH